MVQIYKAGAAPVRNPGSLRIKVAQHSVSGKITLEETTPISGDLCLPEKPLRGLLPALFRYGIGIDVAGGPFPVPCVPPCAVGVDNMLPDGHEVIYCQT